MTRTDPDHTLPEDLDFHDDVRDTTDGPSVVETVATTATGMAVGVGALWFLAPICFVC